MASHFGRSRCVTKISYYNYLSLFDYLHSALAELEIEIRDQT